MVATEHKWSCNIDFVVEKQNSSHHQYQFHSFRFLRFGTVDFGIACCSFDKFNFVIIFRLSFSPSIVNALQP